MKHGTKTLLFLLVFLLLQPVRQLYAAPDSEIVSDVRILVDVSGSMKKNDPNNLRSPALRMVTGLLPDKAMSGVWTFGQYVNMLVPLREVNEAWKLEAEVQSKKVHSYGLFTNIELALNKATANQKTADSRYRRSVILLSDGLVDVSKNEQTNRLSRQGIIDDILPRLKKANVAVHTIALSEYADHELLRTISLVTDGWYEQVDNADQLQRVFLHLFEKAAKRDTVPLLDNNFKIDDSVSEMTLLVFRRENSKPTALILPDQSQITYENRTNSVRWHNDLNYDLITIEQPLSGQWQIDADVDPDNRVMVVTDLKLQTTDLPNNILIGETFDLDASLTEKGEVIIRQDFLSLVDAQLKEESELADAIEKSLNDEQRDGVYQSHIGNTFQVGRNDVVVTMTSDTFERQRRQSINVVATPFTIELEQLLDRDTRTHRLSMNPDTSLIKVSPLNIAALLTAEDGSEWSYEVMENNEGVWQLTLADLQAGEEYSLAIQIRGETLKGRDLFLQPDVIVFNDETVIETEVEVLEDSEMLADLDDELLGDDELLAELDDELLIEDELLSEDELDSMMDEMNGELEDLLIDVDTNEVIEPEDAKEGVAPAVKLAIGNVIILLGIAVAIFMWRRKRSSNNPGEQL